MTAEPFTPDQAAKLAAFDAAPPLVEASDLVRAVLALAAEYEAIGSVLHSVVQIEMLAEVVDDLRRLVATVLAADPEPREAALIARVREQDADLQALRATVAAVEALANQIAARGDVHGGAQLAADDLGRILGGS